MRVGTSNLNDELGQIDFILSDKTGISLSLYEDERLGTITCNEMVYYGFSIGGNLYTRDLEEIRVEDYLHDKVDREIYATFLRALCIVNTVLFCSGSLSSRSSPFRMATTSFTERSLLMKYAVSCSSDSSRRP